MHTEDIRGWLVRGSNGEDDDILFIVPSPKGATHWDQTIVADEIENLIDQYGRFLSVRYWITDDEQTKAAMEEMTVLTVMGVGEADYGMHYSDITGYLWTDEELQVGGHDLLEELKGSVGRFCHLEITFSKTPQEA